jgi:hypothetical protein
MHAECICKYSYAITIAGQTKLPYSKNFLNHNKEERCTEDCAIHLRWYYY